ncbi:MULTISPECIES: nucleoside deaminase [Amycolatopsis]|uniref:Nucleoside deaminase n=1 Tax=Amycolatopsis thermalba TaxID=944492 RepID=A0ABY4NZ51_9PSEU|nr:MULTISPECIES: nucleoside deaminase [Amycolatopsis]OXM75065.1 tRNA-specific adenosine deaminase [Amycolatopsis sp. KNN50.9b]UQS25334.1 nucleoside deaminase [Amycolatopsis thermalba]
MTAIVSVEKEWLARAVELATDNVAAGGGPFGAVVVRDGEIVATGTNQVTPALDPTAHAEVVAIRAACQALGDFKLTGCVLVSSCEPCPMCLASALWARLDRVVYAADRHDAARAGFDDRAFYELFDRPRESWTVPVSRLSEVDGFVPFAAWLDRPDRIEY